jgi:hypothetical protein
MVGYIPEQPEDKSKYSGTHYCPATYKLTMVFAQAGTSSPDLDPVMTREHVLIRHTVRRLDNTIDSDFKIDKNKPKKGVYIPPHVKQKQDRRDRVSLYSKHGKR